MEINVLIRKGWWERYNEIKIVMHFKCLMCDKARVRSSYVHSEVCKEKSYFPAEASLSCLATWELSHAEPGHLLIRPSVKAA